MKKNGMTYIYEERESQIKEHGYTVEYHRQRIQWYRKQELVLAAKYCRTLNDKFYPSNWMTVSRDKIRTKTRIGQLACEGAFLVAHIQVFGDRPKLAARIYECAQEIDALIKAAGV